MARPGPYAGLMGRVVPGLKKFAQDLDPGSIKINGFRPSLMWPCLNPLHCGMSDMTGTVYPKGSSSSRGHEPLMGLSSLNLEKIITLIHSAIWAKPN